MKYFATVQQETSWHNIDKNWKNWIISKFLSIHLCSYQWKVRKGRKVRDGESWVVFLVDMSSMAL